MAAKSIKKLLEQALIQNGEMKYELYQYELEELVAELKISMVKDKDEFLFAVTEHSNDVAMVLIERSGQIYINEQAREKLKALWPLSYVNNMKILIPLFTKQLKKGEIPVNGVKSVSL